MEVRGILYIFVVSNKGVKQTNNKYKIMDKRILVNREFFVEGTWYQPARHIEEKYKSVVRVDYFDTTSSSGDWTGLIVQKIGKTIKVIIFSQENVSDGFNVTTNDSVLCEFELDTPIIEVLNISNTFMQELYY